MGRWGLEGLSQGFLMLVKKETCMINRDSGAYPTVMIQVLCAKLLLRPSAQTSPALALCKPQAPQKLNPKRSSLQPKPKHKTLPIQTSNPGTSCSKPTQKHPNTTPQFGYRL